MGLKSGSRGSGIDEEERETEDQKPADRETETNSKAESRTDSVLEGSGKGKGSPERKDTERGSEPSGSSVSDEGNSVGDTENEDGPMPAGDEESIDGNRQSEGSSGHGIDKGYDDISTQLSVDSLPYKLRRQNVNEGREQVPYFLRPEVTEGEKELKRSLEDDLGETVYKSDYREAAMIVAQRNPELIAEVLREWGYDLTE